MEAINEHEELYSFIEDHKLCFNLGCAVTFICYGKEVKYFLNAIMHIRRAIKQSDEGTRNHFEPNAKIDPRDFAEENKLSKELTLAVSLICEFQKVYGKDLKHFTYLLTDAISAILTEINGIKIDV
jgi:hypothetical protein